MDIENLNKEKTSDKKPNPFHTDKAFIELKKIEFLEKQIEQYEKNLHRKSISRLVLGLFLGAIVSLSLYMLFTRSIPEGNRDVIIAMVSGLTGAFFGSVINYYFGDSESRTEQIPRIDSFSLSSSPPPSSSTSTSSKKDSNITKNEPKQDF